MPIDVLQHAEVGELGNIAIWGEQNQKEFRLHRLDQRANLTVLDRDSISGLIILDGPMQLDEPESWLAAERILIRSVAKRGGAILGIGLGARQISAAFGGHVEPVEAPIYGWKMQTEIKSQQEFTSFVWQTERLVPPAGAVDLFLDDAQNCSGFQYHDQIVGLDFHLEISPDLFAKLPERQLTTDITTVTTKQQQANQLYLETLLTKLFA